MSSADPNQLTDESSDGIQARMETDPAKIQGQFSGSGFESADWKMEFIKAFVMMGERIYKELGQGKETTTAKMLKIGTTIIGFGAAASGRPSGVTISKAVPLVKTLVDALDKSENDQLAIAHAINPDGKSQDFPTKFKKWMIRWALQIWHSYEMQLLSVCREIKANPLSTKCWCICFQKVISLCRKKRDQEIFSQKSKLQGIQELGVYAASRILDSLIEKQIIDNPHQSLTTASCFTKAKSWYENVMVDGLRATWDDEDEIIVNCAQFFAKPIPAFYRPDRHVLEICSTDNCDENGLKERWELRRPFDFEAASNFYSSTEQFLSIEIISSADNTEFVSKNYSETEVDSIYNKLTNDPTFDQNELVRKLLYILISTNNRILEELKMGVNSIKETATKTDRNVETLLEDVEGLKATNEKIIELCSGEKTASSDAIPFWFDVQDPVESFQGRVEFLRRLHSSIQEGGVTVLSQLKIIGGLGGVGKTETARKYILDYKNYYKDKYVIWINAETKTSMEDSFKRLGARLCVEGDKQKNKTTEEIVRECYEIICKTASLVVFDNAQFHNGVNGIEPFMPKSMQPNWKQPYFLITSRNLYLYWDSLTPQLLELDMLEEDECFDFIKKELSSTLEVNEDDAKELGRLLGGLPLALTQAVAYIRENCRKKQLSVTFTLSDYLKQFVQTQEKILSYLPDSEIQPIVCQSDVNQTIKVKKTVMTTWFVTLDLVKTFKDGEFAIGELAIWLSQVLSILSPDGVPVFFLRKIVKGKMDQDKFGEAMDILRRFAFVKYSDDKRSLNMHRLVQFIILEQLQKKQELEKLLDFLVRSCNEFVPRHLFESRNLKDVQMTNSLCVVDKLRLVTPKLEFLLFQIQLAREYRWSSKSDQALALLKEVTARLDQKANKTIQCIIKLESALILNNQRKDKECDLMLKTASYLLPNHLKSDDPDVSEMRDERVMACVLAQQGKRQEALELKNRICKEKLRRWRSNNLYLLQVLRDYEMPKFNRGFLWNELLKRASKHGMEIQNCEVCTEANSIEILECLANPHQFHNGIEGALEMYREWYKEKKKILPADDPSLIQVLADMVMLLNHWKCMGRSNKSESLTVECKKLYEKLMIIKRPYHPCILTTMENFVLNLKNQNMNKESLEVYRRFCEDGEVVWGPYDSRVVWAMERLGDELLTLGQHEEAVQVLKKVDERRCKDFQQFGPQDVAYTKSLYADALRKCGKVQESLEIIEVVRKIHEKILRPYTYTLVRTMENLSDGLWSLGRFDESIRLLQDVVNNAPSVFLDSQTREKLAERQRAFT